MFTGDDWPNWANPHAGKCGCGGEITVPHSNSQPSDPKLSGLTRRYVLCRKSLFPKDNLLHVRGVSEGVSTWTTVRYYLYNTVICYIL